jgi:hypothetical protein
MKEVGIAQLEELRGAETGRGDLVLLHYVGGKGKVVV